MHSCCHMEQTPCEDAVTTIHMHLNWACNRPLSIYVHTISASVIWYLYADLSKLHVLTADIASLGEPLQTLSELVFRYKRHYYYLKAHISDSNFAHRFFVRHLRYQLCAFDCAILGLRGKERILALRCAIPGLRKFLECAEHILYLSSVTYRKSKWKQYRGCVTHLVLNTSMDSYNYKVFPQSLCVLGHSAEDVHSASWGTSCESQLSSRHLCKQSG